MKFKKLSTDSKLLYIYLTSNSTINTVGVVCLSPDSIALDLGLKMSELQVATKELVKNNYIYVKSYDDIIYFIVPAHFSTLSNTDYVLERIKSDLNAIPEELRDFLYDIGISDDKKYKKFDKPTPEEATQHALMNGYLVDGAEFVNYYDEISKKYGKHTLWVDSNGKQIKDWKMKMKRVWFKPKNALKKNDSAPKGFEYFFVKIGDNIYFPDVWRDGKPASKDFLINKEIKREYEKWKRNSE